MSKNVFNQAELDQEREINSYHEQDRIRIRTSEYITIILNTQHYLEQLREQCTHPVIDKDGLCRDCIKDFNG